MVSLGFHQKGVLIDKTVSDTPGYVKQWIEFLRRIS
jgi:hypothetical protein